MSGFCCKTSSIPIEGFLALFVLSNLFVILSVKFFPVFASPSFASSNPFVISTAVSPASVIFFVRSTTGFATSAIPFVISIAGSATSVALFATSTAVSTTFAVFPNVPATFVPFPIIPAAFNISIGATIEIVLPTASVFPCIVPFFQSFTTSSVKPFHMVPIVNAPGEIERSK